jgi:hypothetical protein
VREVRAQAAPAPDLEAILAHPKVAKALEDTKADDEQIFAEQKRITEIPAPPFMQAGRSVSDPVLAKLVKEIVG